MRVTLQEHLNRCNNRFSMAPRLPQELLQELRTYLQHFDQTGHLGESDTVAEIKRRLRDRIGEVEASLKTPPGHATAPDNKHTSTEENRRQGPSRADERLI
jgi:hypothetical protein